MKTLQGFNPRCGICRHGISLEMRNREGVVGALETEHEHAWHEACGRFNQLM